MKYLSFFVIPFLVPLSLQAQSIDNGLRVRAVNYKHDSGEGRLDLFTEIPYSRLTFEATPNGFIAQYRVKTEITTLDPDNRPRNVILSPVWEQTVTEAIYANTIARELSDFSTYSAFLEPANYLVSVTLTDLNSSTIYYREISVQQREYPAPVSLSDVVLLAGFDAERQTILPHISTDVEAGDLQIYFEVYADQAHSLLVTKLLRQRSGRPQSNLPYQWSDTLAIGAGRHQQIAYIPARNLEFGKYDLIVMIQNMAGDTLDRSLYPLSIRWSGLNSYLNNLSQAIDQLSYIARGTEMQEFRRASSDSERRDLLEDFWEKRDPTPSTIRNEAMEEHYYRIDYSNQNFGQQIPGWQSDRGHVFVLHGHPDEVRRQTFSYNTKPWEVWYFFQIGRQFMFVDKTGFGDYELVLPVWDERTRI